jgi:hypothetical protein
MSLSATDHRSPVIAKSVTRGFASIIREFTVLRG